LQKRKKKGVDTTPVVDLHRFGLVLSWFGPLQNQPYEPDNKNFLDRLLKIMCRPWFFGDIERSECEDLLNSSKKKKGTFLVRLNLGGSEEPLLSPFCISKINKEGRVEHIRVYVEPTGFHIHTKVKTAKGTINSNESVQGDFLTMIKRLKSKDVISEGMICQKYQGIFSEMEASAMYFGRTATESTDS